MRKIISIIFTLSITGCVLPPADPPGQSCELDDDLVCLCDGNERHPSNCGCELGDAGVCTCDGVEYPEAVCGPLE